MTFSIRPATPDDADEIMGLIQALAEFEQLTHEVTGTADLLRDHLGGDRPAVEALAAEQDGTLVGYALYFQNYSTFRTRPGLFLEDLFVLPEYRRQGIATALIKKLAAIALDRQCARFEWVVLDWNERAIAVYENLGAKVLPDWRTCRVDGDRLLKLAQEEN